MSIQVQQILRFDYYSQRIKSVASPSTYTQHNMQIKFRAQLDSLKCRAKFKSICFLV